MEIFGNRDSGYGSTPAADVLPSYPNAGDDAATSSRGIGASDIRRVILRMNGDEDIVVGSADGRDNAVQIARNMVLHIEQASTRGEWPQIDERFVRPGAIVSIDVQRSG
jgi:hypothetical protein